MNSLAWRCGEEDREVQTQLLNLQGLFDLMLRVRLGSEVDTGGEERRQVSRGERPLLVNGSE